MTSYYLPSDSKIGAGYVAHRLADVLVRRGHEVTMFSPSRRPDDATYTHVRVPLAGSLRTFRWALRVREIDLSLFHVFHAHGDDHLRVARDTPPHIRTLHGSCFSEALHIRGTRERIRMAGLGCTEIVGSLRADTAVAVSEASRALYPWVRHVIPNGVDTVRFRPGSKDPRPTILFVGTYNRRKRGKLLMAAFENHVLPVIPDARLWMVCSDAPAARNVAVLGRLNDEELADRYRRAWVFCLPSSYEGFGVPYIEAMASGTAVLATPNVGAMEILEGGRYGVIAPPPELGTQLVRLLLDPVKRMELEKAGLERGVRYDWDVVAAAYERVYDDTIAAGSRVAVALR